MFLPSTEPDTYDHRLSDWRNGAVVYQVFVDRFVPPNNRSRIETLLRKGQILKEWNARPTSGKFDKKTGHYTHELEFWGGDLKGVESKLDYFKGVGADVLYLTPIFRAFTNHRYDTEDYGQIDALVGTQQDLRNLTKKCHEKNVKVMLDGVFNHMGSTAPIFQTAKSDPKSEYRDWFNFDNKIENGYLGWYGGAGLPCLNLSNQSVRDHLWSGKKSIVRKYLDLGIDGWRLDVAFDIGPRILSEITQSAHKSKPGSAVIGEISGYPADWNGCVDGVFNFTPGEVMRDALGGQLNGGRAGRILANVANDAPIEHLLKSWLLIDNHDTPRAATTTPDAQDRRLVQAMLMTFPGSPVIYYGSELGMTGKGDPECRAPMQWELVKDSNKDLAWIKKLTGLRKEITSLRVGDFKSLETEKLIGFLRTTNKVRETAIVLFNPTNEPVTEVLAIRTGRILSWGGVYDRLSSYKTNVRSGLMSVDMQPKSVMVLSPEIMDLKGYSPYHRIP